MKRGTFATRINLNHTNTPFKLNHIDMKSKFSVMLAIGLLSSAVSAQQEPSMKQQAQDDWREIRNTAGEVTEKTLEWGKSVGSKAKELGLEAADVAVDLGKKAKIKADELTEQAREASQNKQADETQERKPSGSRFFY